MSVKVRRYMRHGEHQGWEVDIRFTWPSGKPYRERRKAPLRSKTGARRWAEERERVLLARGPAPKRREVPTLEQFSERFIEGYAIANREKPSSVASKRSILRHHLLPRFGAKRLDHLGNEDVQTIKRELRDKSPKTVNNVLSVLSTLLRTAVSWGVLEAEPCEIRLHKIMPPNVSFYEVETYSHLVEAARKLGSEELILVLLGGDAGLRCGEICALEWSDIDFRRGHLQIERSSWEGEVTSPKGGRGRRVRMTACLAGALKAHRHLRGDRVLYRRDGKPYNKNVAKKAMARIQRRAGMKPTGALHILRHTFCSHLAMSGAPARSIQEVAGHKNLKTTEGYMHLSPQCADQAIELLDAHRSSHVRGDMVETPTASSSN